MFHSPFALMRWRISHIVWTVSTGEADLCRLADLEIWILGARSSPLVSGILIGFLLSNYELLMVLGNSGGIAVALLPYALGVVGSFLRNRFIAAGVVCQPHDGGLIWVRHTVPNWIQ